MDRTLVCPGVITVVIIMVQILAVHGTIADQALAAHGITMDQTLVCPGVIVRVITGAIKMVQVSVRLVRAAAGAGEVKIE